MPRPLTTGYLLDLAANAPTYVYAGFKVPEGTDTVDIALGGRSVTMAGIKVPVTCGRAPCGGRRTGAPRRSASLRR